jgi:L-lactate dehydrogenase (cytochrome)
MKRRGIDIGSDHECEFNTRRSDVTRAECHSSRLRDATNIDPSSKILGMDVSLPIYVAPAAMAKLGHPLGEINITKAAGKAGIIQGVSNEICVGTDGLCY